jgi:signal transduction histidine kinase
MFPPRTRIVQVNEAEDSRVGVQERIRPDAADMRTHDVSDQPTAGILSEKELQMQRGFARPEWPIALVKELIDNALDASENAGIPPYVGVTVESDRVTVRDYGPGLPAETLKQSLGRARQGMLWQQLLTSIACVFTWFRRRVFWPA